MVQLDKLIESVNSEETKALARERLEIIQHKIKFVPAIPVAFLYPDNTANFVFSEWVNIAGAIQMSVPEEGVFLIYLSEDSNFGDLLRDVPGNIDEEWESTKNRRVVFMNQDAYRLSDPMSMVEWVEDIAEIIHPGSFIFGHEGDTWMRYG